MLLDTKSQLWKAVGQNDVRHYLNRIEYDKTNDRLLATNGTLLAAVDVIVEPGDIAGPISCEAMKRALSPAMLKLRDGEARIQWSDDGGSYLFADGSSLPAMSDGGTFPNVDRIIPKVDHSKTIEIRLNAHQLSLLASALHHDAKDGAVSLYINPDEPGAPIRVTRHPVDKRGRYAPNVSGVGVIMPMRID